MQGEGALTCPTCGHKRKEKLPPLRPMGMIPYLMQDWEKRLLLKMAKNPLAVHRKTRQMTRGAERWRRDCALFQCGLVTSQNGTLKVTPKGIVAAVRVKEWEELYRRKPTRVQTTQEPRRGDIHE